MYGWLRIMSLLRLIIPPVIVTIHPWDLMFLCSLFNAVFGFDINKNSNLVAYWGQNSAGNQQPLSYYCKDDAVDVIPLAFLYIFDGAGNEPVINFASDCSTVTSPVFPGTQLAQCATIASDIQYCQEQGKIVTLSLGGSTGEVGFSSEADAESFADNIWDLFLGGTSETRPFGEAVLDGIDLDIESGLSDYYAAFVNRIRSNTEGASKTYYITAAPQCPFPDANIGAALNSASFDAIYVQFYNNPCGLNSPDKFNLNEWDNWAKSTSPNPNVKIYIGAAASNHAASVGYVDISTLTSYVSSAQNNYASFGGVMLWDVSEAYDNERYDAVIKDALLLL